MNKLDLPTPAALIDIDVLQRNIEHMAAVAKQAGIRLRPHIKTHKMPVIAQMQLQAGAVGITCAKVSEAEVMAAAGISDILIAYPVIGDEPLRRAMALEGNCHLTLGFDSVYGAERIDEAAKRKGVVADLYMIINTGLHRDGVLPGDEALVLAESTRSLQNVRIAGIMTHEGHVYQAKSLAELETAVRDASRKMVETAEMLRHQGFPVEQVSLGSTPGCRGGWVVPGVTEWRPGTYVFNDVNESRLATPKEECAFSILTTVVSHPAPNRYILDAGSKTLTTDRATEGFGMIKEVPDAVIARLSEEHGVVEMDRLDGLRIGQRVEVVPNHVCPVVNLMDTVYVLRGDQVLDTWTVEARGKIV